MSDKTIITVILIYMIVAFNKMQQTNKLYITKQFQNTNANNSYLYL